MPSANYVGAVASFDQAIEHDPELLDARSYRSYCYMMQIIPGGESDENMRVAEQALEGFQDVLDRDPENELALSSIASVYFNIKDFEKSRKRTASHRGVPREQRGVLHGRRHQLDRKLPAPSRNSCQPRMKAEDPCPIKDQKAGRNWPKPLRR